MYLLENDEDEVFAGYGPTMARPLFSTWGVATQAILFRALSEAGAEMDTLSRVWGIETHVREL